MRERKESVGFVLIVSNEHPLLLFFYKALEERRVMRERKESVGFVLIVRMSIHLV